MLMKKTDVRAGSMLSFTQFAHVVSTFRYASIRTTSSCSSQLLAPGLLQICKRSSHFPFVAARSCQTGSCPRMHAEIDRLHGAAPAAAGRHTKLTCRTYMTFMSSVFIHQM